MTSATYTYDPLGRRVAKTVNGVSTYYLSDGTEEVLELNSSGNVQNRYIFGPGVDEPIVMYAGSGISNGAKRYYRADPQGSIIAITDRSGDVIDVYTYSAYGEPDNAGGNAIRYTGRRWDAETGLYYYRARYYNPSLGRFLQTDPVGYGDNTNLYAYVGNDPTNAKDPSGQECVVGETTTTCETDNYDVTFDNVDGFEDTDPSASDGHEYLVEGKSPLNEAETQEWVKNNPTPGNPKPATEEGTENNATPEPFTDFINSPVVSILTTNEVTGNEVVVNVTLEGHPLGNGIVVRDVKSNEDGTSTITNYGEGNGFFQSKRSPVGEMINNVWTTEVPPEPEKN